MLEPLIHSLNAMRVILASGSKQRKHILESAKVKFEVFPSNYEENFKTESLSFSEFVQQTALGKVEDVYEQLKHDNVKPDVIIGADTMVTIDGQMFGKPKTKEEAIFMIRKLTSSGLPNMVFTGVVIKYENQIFKFTEVTTVYMGKLTDEEILAYVESGEPTGKAGGYGIQGIASSFVKRIDGDCNNVIGLPLYSLTQKLKEILLNK